MKCANNHGLAVIVLLGIALITAVVLQGFSGSTDRADVKARFGHELRTLLPIAIAGSAGHDEPIATTEEMKRAVNELLNYDDAVYRIYRVRETEISVYVAWWSPGRMSSRLVAAHIPDVCWIGNGWVRDTAAETQAKGLNDRLKRMGFVVGQTRVFTGPGRKEHVVYWHKVNEDFMSYNAGAIQPWWAWLNEIRRHGLQLRTEQLFIRVSSNNSLEPIWSREEFAPLREALLKLGLNVKEG